MTPFTWFFSSLLGLISFALTAYVGIIVVDKIDVKRKKKQAQIAAAQ